MQRLTMINNKKAQLTTVKVNIAHNKKALPQMGSAFPVHIIIQQLQVLLALDLTFDRLHLLSLHR